MKRTFLASAISILMMTVPMAAQHGGSPKPTTTHGAPAPKPTTHSSSPHTGSTSHGAQAPKTTTHAAPAPKTTTHASSSHGGATTHAHTTTKASATTHGSGHGATKTTTHGSGHGETKTTTHAPTATSAKTTTETSRTSKKNTATTTTTPTTTTSTTTGTTTSTTTLSPVQQKLLKNTNLASKLQSRLPAGTDLKTAASGFRNLGQFVAAVNVSNNLGIPFAQLKTRMVDQGMSLGQAIQDARPATTDTTVVAHHAETDADDLIRTSEQTTATTKTKKPAKTTRGDR